MENEQYTGEIVRKKTRLETEKILSKATVSSTTIITRNTDIDKGSQPALPYQPWCPEQKWISEGEHYENVY